MNPLVLFSLLLVSVPTGFLAWSVLSVDRKSRAATVAILTRGRTVVETPEEKSGSFLASIGYRVTPPAYARKLDKLLSLAGPPSVAAASHPGCQASSGHRRCSAVCLHQHKQPAANHETDRALPVGLRLLHS